MTRCLKLSRKTTKISDHGRTKKKTNATLIRNAQNVCQATNVLYLCQALECIRYQLRMLFTFGTISQSGENKEIQRARNFFPVHYRGQPFDDILPTIFIRFESVWRIFFFLFFFCACFFCGSSLRVWTDMRALTPFILLTIQCLSWDTFYMLSNL